MCADVQAYLNGVESPAFRNFFTVKTFVAKVIGSALAVGSSLVMGKEGPMLHAGSILAVILGSSNWFRQKMDVASHWGSYTYSRDIRDLVACGASCGVCTAFKAPVGGVLFAMEMSTRWRKELTWRCFLVSALTIVVVRWSISACVAHGHCAYLRWGSLAWFSQAYPAPYSQIWAFILLAVAGGWVASVFTAFNTWVCLLRKKWSKFFSFRIAEVCALSVLTSVILFALPLGGRCHACDTGQSDHCVKSGSACTCMCRVSGVRARSTWQAAQGIILPATPDNGLPCPHHADASMFRTIAGYGCSNGEFNDLAVLVFNPQVRAFCQAAPPQALPRPAGLVNSRLLAGFCSVAGCTLWPPDPPAPPATPVSTACRQRSWNPCRASRSRRCLHPQAARSTSPRCCSTRRFTTCWPH